VIANLDLADNTSNNYWSNSDQLGQTVGLFDLDYSIHCGANNTLIDAVIITIYTKYWVANGAGSEFLESINYQIDHSNIALAVGRI